ncbi:MAG: DJ-1/PfpI family protein [Alphaproteobacteria bacterium]|nr:DJ-1/PfpI family protein [Alphaproteobacteria bacterium]
MQQLNIGILLFDDAEELDFVGPWEVFTMANEMASRAGRAVPHAVRLLAEKPGAIRCAKGMRVLPDALLRECTALDVLLIPGGIGTRRESENRTTLDWIAAVAKNARWVTSVCTGSLLLAAAGPARGKRVATHWAFADTLEARGEGKAVLRHSRYVRDGNVVTAAGVSAGIDMALWLVGEWHGAEFARTVQRGMEYDPAPPYQGLV